MIQDVTRAERRRSAASPHGGLPSATGDIQYLQDKFEYTRTRTLQFSREMNFGTEQLRHDFSHIVDVFHDAGIIYGCQALVEPSTSAETRAHCLESLLENLSLIINTHAFSQDLVWPLFIAGTESCFNRRYQQLVESKLLEAMRMTGFSNCYQALLFLRSFWNTDHAATGNWMQFARQEARRGTTFLVL